MPRMTGKQALAQMLMAEGVEYVFGNPGTSETPLMDALQDFPELKYITALQEASAVGIADGYARASGKPAFANVHIAGGLANAISMLYNSFRGGTPLVLTAGNSDTRMFLADPVLSGDLVGMTRQYSKWSHEIIHGADVPVAVRRAFKEATTPPTGPVFVSFPWDSLDDEADVDTAASFPGYHRTRPDPAAVSKAVEVLSQAENPIMVVGDRVAQSNALSQAVQVAELTGAKVFASSTAEVNFPTSHPQFLGALNLNNPAAARRIAEADVLLAVGAPVFSSFLYNPEPFVGSATRVIHIDSSGREIGKVYPTEVGMLCDPGTGLADLADALQAEMPGSAQESARSRALNVAQEKQKSLEAFQKRTQDRWDRSPMSVERMMAELTSALPKNTIIADESVTSRGALHGAMDFDEVGSLHGITGGALGWGMPGAVGIKLAQPDRPVVAVVGDGASLYSIQALWTAVRYKLPVVWVICNNRAYKVLKVNMDIYLKDMIKDESRQSQYIGMDFDPNLNLASIAEGFGVNSRRVEDPATLRQVVEDALASGQPSLVDVVIES